MVSPARLGNISGVLLLTQRGWISDGRADDRAAAALAAGSMSELFEETLLVGGDPSADWSGLRVNDPQGDQGELYSFLAACEAATSDRVLVAESDAAGSSADLLLALTAWPESDAVIVSDVDADTDTDTRGDGGLVLCSAFRRERCAEMAREALGAGALSLSAFRQALVRVGETQEISVERLGLADWRQGLRKLGGAD